MPALNVLDWGARILIGAVLVVGIGAGAFFAVRTSDDDDSQVVAQLTETPATPAPTDTPALPTALPPTQPPPTEPPPTDVPRAPTPDTRVPMGLPTADQIQLGKDGKYFIADRGDGCTWLETLRETSPTFGLEVFLQTDCPADFTIIFRPETGEVSTLIS